MKKLIVILTVATLYGCQKEVCTQCTEVNTGTKSSYCGTKKEVKEYKDALQNNVVPGYQQWSCN